MELTKRTWGTILAAVALLAAPLCVFAAGQDPALSAAYARRPDLQKAFDPKTWNASGSGAGFLIDLRDWAEQYGWREDPSLSAYAPSHEPPAPKAATAPIPSISGHAFIVLDRETGEVLAEHASGVPWPIASLTKLMNASLVLDSGVSLSTRKGILAEDEVGGARVNVVNGAAFTLDDLLYAALVGSANNAASAAAHAADPDTTDFVSKMNARAADMALPHTHYADPTGMDPANVSTPREIARLTRVLFDRSDIRRYTSTAAKTVTVLQTGAAHTIKNTDWMLWKPEYNDVYVTSGKTGYLDESQWNVVVSLRPSPNDKTRELLIVVFGADSRADSFKDANALADWAWANEQWSAK